MNGLEVMEKYLGLEVLEEHTEVCASHGEYKRYRTNRGTRGRCEPCWEADQQRRNAEAEARMNAEKVTRILEHAHLPPRFAAKGFVDYAPKTPAQKKALAACTAYAENIAVNVRSGTCLVLIGPPGTGKTHLLVSVLRASAQSLCWGSYTSMTSFMAAVKGSWAWHGAELGGDFLKPKVLVLDEVWIPQSGRDRETMLALLDERYRAGVPTLIGSNLSWPQMEKELGGRFCDRLLEGGGQVVALDGKSARR